MSIDIWSVSPLAALVLAALLIYLRRQGKSFGYLLCVTGFYVYLMIVARWTVFPLRFDEEFIEAFRRETTLISGINLVPFRYVNGLSPISVQVYGNFLLGIPFGFGLPFLLSWRSTRVIAAGAVFSLSIELLQLLIDLAYGFAYRAVDINDFILVWLGTIAGYALLRVVAMAYRRIIGSDTGDQGIWAHAHWVLTR